jgi:UDP-N-acetylglucosamine--dolichyl-phosphate N-acetylglucosaminephosphotransferase
VADALTFAGAFAAALTITYVVVPWLIPKLKARGIAGKDLNKFGHPEIAEMGGIAVVMGFFAGVSILLASDGVTKKDVLNVSLSVILGAAFIGMVDDLFELKQRQKALFPFLLALPIGAALDPIVYIPFVGEIDFGPWMLVAGPFAITCAANAGNMLEGFNGLGTGLGIIMCSTLIALSVEHDRLDGLYILVPLLGALTAFLWYNKYPARIFPGDTLMLFMGASLAVAGMLSDLHIQTAFIFLPMIAEFLLKLRGRFRAENYSSDADGNILRYEGRIESLTHIFMRKMKVTERRLVLHLWLLEVVMCGIVLVVDLAI